MKTALLLSIITLYISACTNEELRNPPSEISVKSFEEITVNFSHEWDKDYHPFSGATVLDYDNNGTLDIFIGGGNNQNDALFTYKNGQFTNVIANTGLSSPNPTYGTTSIDIDNNGYSDIITARDNGITLYLNNNGTFTPQNITLSLKENEVPLSVAASDIDNDGDADLYVSVFISKQAFKSATFNDPHHAKKNILLRNEGNLNFKDITNSSNTAGLQNTFYSSFTDLNNDGFEDLIIAQNTGQVEIYKNNRNQTFSKVNFDSGYGFWMGLAIGDYDNDNDPDLFFSNLGNSIPSLLTTGDLTDSQPHNPEWLLLRNDGNFNFTNQTEETQLTNHGFAWGAVFEDLNLDGKQDLLVAQNYIKWPLHKISKLPGKSFIQNNGEFYHLKKSGLENPYFGQSPIIIDFNNDAKPDVVWLNMNGPLRAFINQSENHSIAFRIPDTTRYLGATMKLQTTRNRILEKQLTRTTGLLTNQSPDIVFALKPDEKIRQATIILLNGTTKPIKNLEINTVNRL